MNTFWLIISASPPAPPAREPQEAVIGFLVLFFVLWVLCLFVAAWFKDLTSPPPPPPFLPSPITIPAASETTLLSAVQREEYTKQFQDLVTARARGWPYRAALTLLTPQLGALRGQLDRLLVATPAGISSETLTVFQLCDYRRHREGELRERLPQLSDLFSRNLACACENQDLDEVVGAVNRILRSCHWIVRWAEDHYRYREEGEPADRHRQGPRVADHVLRQVELLVSELRRCTAAPDFTGPLLFRAEFYYPKDEEIDRPVLAVIAPPSNLSA